MNNKYEHHHDKHNDTTFDNQFFGGEEEYLERMSNEGGWELVSVCFDGRDKHYYWKRPHNEDNYGCIFTLTSPTSHDHQ